MQCPGTLSLVLAGAGGWKTLLLWGQILPHKESWAEICLPVGTRTVFRAWVPNGIHPPTLDKASMALPTIPCPETLGPNGMRRSAAIWEGNLAALGPDHCYTITTEPLQLPLRRGNKPQLVLCSHQLILIDTTLRSESSTPSQFTFLLNHTGKLGALLLLSDPTRVLCSPTTHRVGKHPGISGSTVSSRRSPSQSSPFCIAWN